MITNIMHANIMHINITVSLHNVYSLLITQILCNFTNTCKQSLHIWIHG